MRRQACDAWPAVLDPAAGCYPLATPPRGDERVLHVAYHPNIEAQQGFGRALQAAAGAYAVVDWYQLHGLEAGRPGTTEDALCTAAHALRPTVVLMQLQMASAVTSAVVARLRTYCDPRCVILNWSGDMHYPPDDPRQAWFLDLGRACDASLTVETQFSARYAALGVRRPGFWQVAVDDAIYRPAPPTPGGAAVVFLGSRIAHAFNLWGGQAYRGRLAAVQALAAACPDTFAAHGFGWDGCAYARPWLAPSAEPGVYAAAAAALSISITNDITRYTSGRLYRALASGAVILAERFPDHEGCGLVDGVNCLLWESADELPALAREAVATLTAPRWAALRDAAAATGREHTWTARMPELQAIINAIRGSSQ